MNALTVRAAVLRITLGQPCPEGDTAVQTEAADADIVSQAVRSKRWTRIVVQSFLCPEGLEDFHGWPGAKNHADTSKVPHGTLLDYRPVEQRLQSHADLWLRPLTGAPGGVWPDVLDQAARILAT
ncbi:hypothetical protein [Streptomyces sp. NPDC057966]|uniref:hypothetical protein n=1 Tax=Streptomyces sp. NPDC057966 TaxID=3346292 RepID=UPI0036E2525B